MTRRDMATVFKAIDAQLEKISAGPDGQGQRNFVEPLLKRISKEKALELISAINMGYDSTKDPYGKRKPKLSDFVRRVNQHLRSGAAADWMEDLRHGQIVTCNHRGNDYFGIVERTETDTLIWTTSESKVHKLVYWCVVSRDAHSVIEWDVVRPDVGKQQVEAWWRNWRNDVYDGCIPFGPLKAAAERAGVKLEVDGNEVDYPFIMMDGKPTARLEKPKKPAKKVDARGGEPMTAFESIAGMNIGKKTGDDAVPF